MAAEIDASRCLVCLSLSTSPVAESIVRRVRDLLEVATSTGEGLAEFHLCNVCRGTVEEIDRLIAEFKQTYQDAHVRVVQNPTSIPEEKLNPRLADNSKIHNVQNTAQHNVSTPNAARSDITENTLDDVMEEDADDVMTDDDDVTESDAGDVIPEEGVLKKKRTNYSCGCGEVYYGARALEAHRQAVHGGGVPCRDCGVVLNTPQQLQAHSLVHKKDKFNCNVCGVGFHRALYLRNHQRLSKTCSASANNLTTSQQTITECGCGESFATSAELKVHRETSHRGRFVCANCDRTFGTFGTLTRHMHFHSNDVFDCPCGESFKHPTYLQIHQRRFHKQQLPEPRQNNQAVPERQSTESATREEGTLKEGVRIQRVTRGRTRVKGEEKGRKEGQESRENEQGEKGVKGKDKEGRKGQEKGKDEGARSGVKRRTRERKGVNLEQGGMVGPEGEVMEGRTGREKGKGERQGEGTGKRGERDEEKGCDEVESEESAYEAETETEEMEVDDIENNKAEEGADDNTKDTTMNEVAPSPTPAFGVVPEISCVACDTTYRSKSHFDKHIHKYHWQSEDNGKRHQCVMCTKSLRSLRAIVNHARQHRSQMHACRKCDSVFAKKEHLMEHSISSHKAALVKEEKVTPAFKCEDCGKTEPTRSLLSAHMLVEHQSFGGAIDATRQRPHQCSFCNMSFASRRDLQKHTTKHARALRDRSATPFECPECKKQCKTAGGLEKHVQNFCPGKDGVYDDGTGRLKRSFLCSLCGAMYKTRSGYEMHLSKHTGEGQYTCTECPQKFRMKAHLTKHLAGHTRPFMCAQCGKRFTSSNHLNEHQLIHSTDLNFSCVICNEKFRWRLSLARHQWRSHGLGSAPKQYRKLMLCKLCNTEVSRNARTSHIQNQHKEVTYSSRHFKCLPCNTSQGKGPGKPKEGVAIRTQAPGRVIKPAIISNIQSEVPSGNLTAGNSISGHLTAGNLNPLNAVSGHLTVETSTIPSHAVVGNIANPDHVRVNAGTHIATCIPVSNHPLPVSQHLPVVTHTSTTNHSLPGPDPSIEIRPIAEGMYAMLDTSRGDLAVLSSSSANHYMVQSGHPPAISVPVSVAVSTSAPPMITSLPGQTQSIAVPAQHPTLLTHSQHIHGQFLGSGGETGNAWTHPFPTWQ